MVPTPELSEVGRSPSGRFALHNRYIRRGLSAGFRRRSRFSDCLQTQRATLRFFSNLVAPNVHLYLFLLVVVSLACGSLPPVDVSLPRAALATFGMLMAWAMLCHIGARICAKQVASEAIEPIAGAEIIEKQLSAFRWLGLGVVVLCLGGFGLARNLDAVPVVGGSLFLQSLVLLAPGLIINLATWSAEHRYGVLLGYTESGWIPQVRSLWQTFRTNMAWLFVPVACLLALSDVISRLPISPMASGGATVVTVLLFVCLGLPWLVRRLFPTEPLQGATHQWMSQLVRDAGLRRTKIARWQTGGRTFNAMVVGFIPPMRTMLISDRLLDELPRAQLAMVILHEAAHLKRKHVPMRMLAILPAWGIAALISRLAGESQWFVALGSAVGILLTMLILRWVAYRTEYDADLEACRMAAEIADRVELVPSTCEQACEALSAALMRVTFDQPSCRKATWLHPGVADRIAFMRRHCAMPTPSASNAGTVANPA